MHSRSKTQNQIHWLVFSPDLVRYTYNLHNFDPKNIPYLTISVKQSADQHTIEALRQENKKVKFEKEEAATKLSVLQEYFKTKEIDMQR